MEQRKEYLLSDWSPDDPALSSDRAPHEISGVLRWHRAKVPSKEIMSLLKLRGTQLISSLERAVEQERAATSRGLDIHDEGIPKECS